MELFMTSYFNRRNYILENMDSLGLSSDEVLTLLLIDFANEQNKVLSHQFLASKLNYNLDEIDGLLTRLASKGLLEIKMENRQILFDISGVFKQKKVDPLYDKTLYELFEHEFGRTFSQMEASRISDWVKVHDRQLIIYALREAVMYDKKNLDYIDGILRSWKERSLTVQDIENGNK